MFAMMPNIFSSISHFVHSTLPHLFMVCFHNPPCATPIALAELSVPLLHPPLVWKLYNLFPFLWTTNLSPTF